MPIPSKRTFPTGSGSGISISLVEELEELLEEALEEGLSEEGWLLEDSLSLELGSFSELVEKLSTKLELLEEL